MPRRFLRILERLIGGKVGYSCWIFPDHIGFIDKIEISIKEGTDAGVCGVRNLLLTQVNTDSYGVKLTPLEAVAAGPNAVLRVTALYNGESKSISDIPKYRSFYRGILYSALTEIELNDSLQEQLSATEPKMTINIHRLYEDGARIVKYSFFADNSVLIDGVYVGKLTDGQLDALISATGLMLSSDTADIIDFWS